MATPAAKIPMLISSLVDRFHHACRAHPLRKLNTRPRSSSPRNVSTTAPPNDFSLSANPASLTLNQNSTGTSAISTAVTSGNPQTVNLTVGGCPSGASCTVSPTSITSGNGSTLTINSRGRRRRNLHRNGDRRRHLEHALDDGGADGERPATAGRLLHLRQPEQPDRQPGRLGKQHHLDERHVGQSAVRHPLQQRMPERRELHLRHQPDPVPC